MYIRVSQYCPGLTAIAGGIVHLRSLASVLSMGLAVIAWCPYIRKDETVLSSFEATEF